MAVNCTLCSASMTTAERTTNLRGQAVAGLHNDCAYLENIQYWRSKQLDYLDKQIMTSLVNRLSAKKAGTAAEYP